MNDQYCHLTGRAHAPLSEEPEEAILGSNISSDEDIEKFKALFGAARENPLKGATADIGFATHDTGEAKRLLVRLFFLRRVKNREIFFASFEEIK